MTHTRRHFLRSAWAMGAAAPAFATLANCTSASGRALTANGAALEADPLGFLDLPAGFTYQRFSEVGSTMSDGFRVPADHDGMGCFAVDGRPELCVLVRNHELAEDETEKGPFGKGAGLPPRLDAAAIFDIAPNEDPVPGGTTTLIYNTETRMVEDSFLSMVGTARNCSGGITPWGSWLTCEESEAEPGRETSQYHGYAFEVPASARGLVAATPLREMGRFNREAAAVDPKTGIVYQTEDSGTGLFYRYIPNQPGELDRGGRTQALAIIGIDRADTRNWKDTRLRLETGQRFAVHWLDLEDVEAFETPLQDRGFAKGCARFARGEGIAWAIDQAGSAAYFACTNGGAAKAGQIWRYVPSPYEGTSREAEAPGQLILYYESPDRNEMDMCDNLVPAPWGHLIICEDGEQDDYIRGVTPDGRVYPIARSATSEFAGACFSPDGDTMFVNVQKSGTTVAIRGPWASIAMV